MALKTYILLLLALSFPSHRVIEPIILWNAAYKLSWKDFKAKPNTNSSAVAITASGLTFGFSIDEVDKKVVRFSTEIETHFYPEQSWYKPGEVTPHVLGHEQLHFDITELHARKFRKRVSRLKTSQTIAKELRALHRTINQELAAFQNKYDVETNYSRHVEQQAYWQKFVAEELQKHAAFASKTVLDVTR
jgi:hypothetical protein